MVYLFAPQDRVCPLHTSLIQTVHLNSIIPCKPVLATFSLSLSGQFFPVSKYFMHLSNFVVGRIYYNRSRLLKRFSVSISLGNITIALRAQEATDDKRDLRKISLRMREIQTVLSTSTYSAKNKAYMTLGLGHLTLKTFFE